jgi:thiamine pyrophosphate-dependent acetolactate synthase large subunit-like protein
LSDSSSIEFIPVRHEQGGAHMADAYGRLTGRAGVCLGTLGPGATNLVTAVADAFLDRAPLVAVTGQSDLERMDKESHQYIDLIGILYPIVKWNARVSSPEIVSEVVRKAFGLPAWRCSSAEDFPRLLRDALAKDVPSVIVVPIDYSIDVAISETLGAETVAT